MLSEWTMFLVRDVDSAFCSGADLAAILAAQAAIECHLRYEYSAYHSRRRLGFYDLIEQSPLACDLKEELHRLRVYRNRWVHVEDPHNDEALLQEPEVQEANLAQVAIDTMRTLRRVLYLEQML